MKKEISLIKFFFIFLDIFLFFLSLYLVLYLRFGLNSYFEFQKHFLPFFFLLPFYILFLISFDLYNFFLLNLKSLFLKILNFLLISFLFSTIYFYFTQIIFSISPRTNLILFLIIFNLFLSLTRILLIRIYQKKKINVYFLGEEKLKEKLENDLKSHTFFNFQGYFDKENIDEKSILIISPNYQLRKKDLKNSDFSKIIIFDFIDFYEKFLGRIPLEAINFNWVIKNIFLGESKINFYLKRIIDLILSSLVFIFIFLPLILPISILIYLNSPGPIFFLNKRIGYRNKSFKLIKFRTMSGNQEKQKWAGEEKNRIFFIGKVLRKTHLDELPQIINILKGELSFVGPRPEQPEISQDLENKIEFYELRNLILPGLTGWAQVNYKYPENLEETKIKLEYDLYYLKNYNIFLDILIIIKTFQKFFS